MNTGTKSTATTLCLKLQSSPAGDRHLDADVYEAFGCQVVREGLSHRHISWRFKALGIWLSLDNVTTSVDAALLFVAEHARGAHISLSTIKVDGQPRWIAEVGAFTSAARSAPLALCCALLLYRDSA